MSSQMAQEDLGVGASSLNSPEDGVGGDPCTFLLVQGFLSREILRKL